MMLLLCCVVGVVCIFFLYFNFVYFKNVLFNLCNNFLRAYKVDESVKIYSKKKKINKKIVELKI